MRSDSILAPIAEHLGLTIVRPLAGGEFGATLVTDAGGREIVLKALPSEDWAPGFARGAAIANRLRADGYPAPEYVGTGTALGGSWSLQERLPGEIPHVVSEAHMRQLLDLAERHDGAATAADGSWLRTFLPYIEASLNALTNNATARSLALELRAALERLKGTVLLDNGIVHGDFHHRNFLAIGDAVTGVFDWEFASTGDWRYDLVTLAFWAALLPAWFPGSAGHMAIDRARERCPGDVLALLTALKTTLQLGFDATSHPERLTGIVAGVEAHVASWWRAV